MMPPGVTPTPVESSQIQDLAWKDDVMYVTFHSGVTYSYQNVSYDLYREIVGAESVGSTFHQRIKKHPDLYPYKKL